MITAEFGKEKIGAPIALALGTFDGLHIGHMAVINQVLSSEYESAVISFYPKSPREVLSENAPKLILSHEKKREKLQKIGIKYQILIDFQEIKNHTAQEFIDKLLTYYNIKLLSCGYNFRFGKGGAGDAETLRKACSERGLDCFVADEVRVGNRPCSSGEIRKCLEQGDISAAEQMLGYPLQ